MPECRILDAPFIRTLIRPRPLAGHKGTFGHALLIAGSEGKVGAAMLAAKAAMRTGCGLVSVHITPKAANALTSYLPEAMIIPRKKKVQAYPDYAGFSAVGFGPGVGTTASSEDLLFDVLKFYRGTLVLDADGITLIAKNKDWIGLTGSSIIFTPHPKEFDRLTRPHNSDEERLETQLAFAVHYKVTVVLKGHHTKIATPSGETFSNTTGNDGMATGGSGDVLTGIITSLCAQGYAAENAAILGTYLHGFAGDRAASSKSKTSLIASDIIEALPQFFVEFER